ncbi:MAG: MarR family winged helix-turn-helix transcriptional regulator [Nitriliruptoraceae bacterium]
MADLEPARPARLPPGRLAAELLEASVWFDRALLARLEASGWPRLSPTRSRVFLALSAGSILVSDLARELDVSRQAAHKLLDSLEDDGLVARQVDEHDRRAQRIRLTDRGRALAAAAGRILPELEEELARRIGHHHLDALRAALAPDRGPPPVTSGREPP